MRLDREFKIASEITGIFAISQVKVVLFPCRLDSNFCSNSLQLAVATLGEKSKKLKWVGSLFMTKVIIKSLVLGFIIGTVFFGLAPFGLGIAFVEFLKPILIPGIDLFRLFWQNTPGSSPLVPGLILNGIIYTLLFFTILLIRKHVISIKVKFLTILFVVLSFLAVTGMFTNVYLFLTSPNKSWIFEIGP